MNRKQIREKKAKERDVSTFVREVYQVVAAMEQKEAIKDKTEGEQDRQISTKEHAERMHSATGQDQEEDPDYVKTAKTLAKMGESDYSKESVLLANLNNQFSTRDKTVDSPQHILSVLTSLNLSVHSDMDYKSYPLIFSIFRMVVKEGFVYISSNPKLLIKRKKALENSIQHLVLQINMGVHSGMVFSPTQTAELVSFCKGMKLYDIGGGSGFSANLLARYGLDVKSCDIRVDAVLAKKYQKLCLIEKMSGEDFVKKYTEEIKNNKSAIIFICPLQKWECDITTLREFEKCGGEYVIFGGDKTWCGSPYFWLYIEYQYTLIKKVNGVHIFPVFSMVPEKAEDYNLPCNIYIWKKNLN